MRLPTKNQPLNGPRRPTLLPLLIVAAVLIVVVVIYLLPIFG